MLEKFDGKWEAWFDIDKNGQKHRYLCCSKCGSETEIFGKDEMYWMSVYAYCPWCGARLQPEHVDAGEED